MIGIYKITSPKGKIYIGQTIDSNERFYHYQKLNCKDQIRIYRSLYKYGWQNHTFEIIEECLADELNCKERYWQDFYNVIGISGLNCKLTPCGEKRMEISEETKNKISNKLKGIKHTAERTSNMIKGITGLKRSQDIKDKMSKRMLIQAQDSEWRIKCGVVSRKTVYQYTLEDILIKQFESTREVEEIFNFPKGIIARACRSKNKKYKGFKWSYQLITYE